MDGSQEEHICKNKKKSVGNKSKADVTWARLENGLETSIGRDLKPCSFNRGREILHSTDECQGWIERLR